MRKKMRMVFEIFAPPIIAVAGLLTWDGLSSLRWPEWNVALVMLAYAYFFAGVPSVIYALMMEKAFAQGVPPGSWASVGRSTGLGLAAGAVIGAGMGFLMSGFTLEGMLGMTAIFGAIFMVIGLGVGLIMGLILKFLFPAPKEHPLHHFLRWDRPFEERR
jgi:hypothetical protein